MTNTDNNPSLELDPASTGAMGGLFRFVLNKFLQKVDGCLPCTVLAVDAKRNYVTVQPNIMVLGTNGQLVARAQIASVPVFTMGAGNFVMSWPIAAGDLGWVIANDRDISLYLQAQAPAGPNTNRLHSFSDGVFFPDKARQWALADEDANNAVWQSLDGTIKVTLGSTKIKMLHPTLVEVDAPLLQVNGDITATGTITGQTDVIGSGKSLKTHTHSGVTTGGGDTGPPV